MDMRRDSQNTQHNEKHQEEQEQHFHVLAVDDSILDRKLLERLLTVSSYQVTCVESGNKALEYLGLLDDKDNANRSSDPSTSCTSSSPSCCCPSSAILPHSSQQEEGSKVNLIITDYSMPGMSGYDLLRKVKGSSWKDIPVVVMSSENVPSRINMCLEGGAEEFLLKPLQLSDLRNLQFHLLKSTSLGHPSCKNLDDNFAQDVNNNNNNNNNDNKSLNDISTNNNEKSNNNANKRKVISPERSDRRPKMKELAVV